MTTIKFTRYCMWLICTVNKMVPIKSTQATPIGFNRDHWLKIRAAVIQRQKREKTAMYLARFMHVNLRKK